MSRRTRPQARATATGKDQDMKPCDRRPCRRRAGALQALAKIAANLPAYMDWHAKYGRALRRPVPPTRKRRPEYAAAGGFAAAANMTPEERSARARAGGLAKARKAALAKEQTDDAAAVAS